MTVQYAIVAFPNLHHADQIESVRRRFDPLAAVLSAHVTLVFPFADDALAPLLDEHIRKSVAGMSAFDVTLSGPIATEDGYLFLNVADDAGHIVELHRRLYDGVLAPYRSPTHVYQPHITIGRFATTEQLAAAAAATELALPASGGGRIHEVAVFALDQPTSGTIRFVVSLA
jgi:2'-5' RNA ligase